LAERTGLIEQLTTEVLAASIDQCATWRDEGLDITVAVNLSPRSLLDAELPTRVDHLLSRRRLSAAALQVEITESNVVTEVDSVCHVLEDLRFLGVTCAIDDFGTGYSSLAQPQRLPVDELQIERS